MIVVLDGPEAAGKSTIRDALVRTLERGPTVHLRQWGPVDSWMDYIDPLQEDLGRSAQGWFVVWDRGWAAEVVYNELLARGREVPETAMFTQFELPIQRAGGVMVMVLTDPEVLEDRRRRRAAERAKPDLPVDPTAERERFGRYAAEHEWTVVDGARDPIEVAETIHTALRIRSMR